MLDKKLEKRPCLTRALNMWKVLSVLLLLLLSNMALAQVSASLNRTTLYEGDTVLLTLERNSLDGSAAPDLSPLSKDFEVLGTGSGTQVQIINGHRSDKRQWHVTLRPLHMGTLAIPPIQIGKERTQPLSVSVIETPQSAATASGAGLFLESHVESKDVYLQQQIRYVTRLYYRVPLLQGQLSDPVVADAVVERLGEDKKYTTQRNGSDYNVIERSYAIFPEKSGELRIPPVRFQGEVEAPQQAQRQRRSPGGSFMDDFFGRDPFDDPFFNSLRHSGEAVALKSQGATVKVKPQPGGYTGRYWIPAASLTLEDSWLDAMPSFKVGEPVTRTITVTAKGLTASQLPDIELPTPPGVSLYAEKPVTESRTDGDWVYAITRITATYVPKREGMQSVPEVKIDWWNTQTQKQETATLQAWKVPVAHGELAEEPAAAPQDSAAPDQAAETRQATSSPAGGSESSDQASGMTENGTDSVDWRWVMGGLGLLLLAAMAWYLQKWRIQKRKRLSSQGSLDSSNNSGRQAASATRVSAVDITRATRALESACEENDPHRSARALLDLAALQWQKRGKSEPSSLGALAGELRQGSDLVMALDAVLYGNSSSQWQGDALFTAVKAGMLEPSSGEDERVGEALPPLYPQ
ncbi:MAG: BatD family protein [bacterium]